MLPALLVVLFGGAFFVVTSSGGTNDTQTSSNPPPVTTATNAKPKRRMVTVRSGDTPTSIADSAGITLNRLYELNPDLDPRTLRPGQTLKLAR